MNRDARPGLSQRKLKCGMELVVERMAGVASCGLSWLVPVGSSGDPAGAAGEGESTLLAELIARGAGSWDSRAHSDALDALGVQRRTSASTYHTLITATLVADHLESSLPLLAAMIRRPRFDAAQLDPVRSLALQGLEGLADDPQHLAMVRLAENHLPPPYNRSGFGDAEGLRSLTIESLRSAWQRRCVPNGSILGIAGAVDADSIAAVLDPLLDGWTGRHGDPALLGTPRAGTLHIPQESAQTHMGLALWAPCDQEETSLRHRLAMRIFGGEASSRLFIEVREKRGLCYSVGASAAMGRDRGMTSIYAGSTPERAATTLEQIRHEIRRFAEGITREEFDRAIVGFRSRLVMQGESTSARAGAIAGDVHRLGRARTLEEVAQEAAELTFGSVNEYARGELAARWAGGCTLVVVGPAPLS